MLYFVCVRYVGDDPVCEKFGCNTENEARSGSKLWEIRWSFAVGGQDQGGLKVGSSDGLVETMWKLLSYVKRFVSPAFETYKGQHSRLQSILV